MKKVNKKYLVTLLIIIVAVGIYFIKDDGSKSKSITVDKDLSLANGEYYGDKGCENVYAALNIRVSEKDVKQGDQPTSYELTCDPDKNAIKIITGSENSSVRFTVELSNFTGSTTFVCKKGGTSQTYNVTNKGQKATLLLTPQYTFQIPKEKNSSESITCTNIPDSETSHTQIDLNEYVGGLKDGTTNRIKNIDDSSYIENYTPQVATSEYSKSKDEPMEQDNPLVDQTMQSVQRNRYLLDDTANYTENKNYSRSFNYYHNNGIQEIEDFNKAPANRKYTASIEGDMESEDARITNVKRGDGVSISGNINLSCNYNLSATDIQKILKFNLQDTYQNDGSGHLTHYFYDQNNTNYFYASSEVKISEPYQWHTNIATDKSYTKKSGETGCTRICEEIVKVEYGPPIAIKAGMCFEYRVKVSSIVNCGVKEGSLVQDDVNKVAPDICRPVPYCWSNVKQEEMKIAGPSEEYDSCIKDCDGGKYSDKCSNKCYKQIYGKKDNKLNTTPKQINPTFINSKQANCTDGMYYRTGSSINWCIFDFQLDGYELSVGDNGLSAAEKNSLYARSAIYYYNEQYSWPTYSTKYQVSSAKYLNNSAGIIRGIYKQGGEGIEECHDNCYWQTENCGGKDGNYIEFNYKYYQDQCNKGVVRGNCKSVTKCKTYQQLTGIPLKDDNGNDFIICTSDDLKNAEKIYNSRKQKLVIEKCQAATSCHRTQSEYRIQYNVATSETEAKPFENYSTLQNGQSRSNIPAQGETLLSYGGCYANNDINNRWYQAEWTIPGTWVKLKGNKVSYDKEAPDKDAYTFQKGKICLPSNLKETNKDWALAFYGATQQINTDDPNPRMTISFNNTFDNGGKGYISRATSSSSSEYPINGIYSNDNEYTGFNIFANSKNFGHYKWGFTISCFYAYSKENPPAPTGNICNDGCTTNSVDPCDECKKDSKDTETGYTIRSFDEDDALLVGKGVQQKTLDITKARNNIPFNWSSAAQMRYMTKGGYNADPYNDILANIENSNPFDNNNLDYQITINERQINALRSYNKENAKGTEQYVFNGEHKSDNGTGVIYYVSPILGKSEYMTKVGGDDLHNKLGCNNKACGR